MEKKYFNFNADLIKNDEKSNKGYIFEVDVEYPKRLHNLHSDLAFLPGKTKAKKCNNLIWNLYDKNNYIVHIRALKQALNHGLVLQKFHRIIKFNQKAWLKSYIDMDNKLKTEAKSDFEKDLFKLMNSAVFWKTMKNVRKRKNIRLITTDKRINYLVWEPNYHTQKNSVLRVC